MEWDGINKRRFIRINFPYTIHLHWNSDVSVSAYTEDVSSGGIRVVVKKKLEVSTVLDLEIYLSQIPIVCKGKVIWIKDKENFMLEGTKFFDVGIALCDIDDEQRNIFNNCIKDLEKRTKTTE